MHLDLSKGRWTNLTNHTSWNINPAAAENGEVVFASTRSHGGKTFGQTYDPLVPYSQCAGVEGVDLFVMDRDGQNVRKITSSPLSDFDPAWSPGGTRIAFARNDGKKTEVYVINKDGTELRKLTDLPGNSTLPSFSPDGSQVLFLNTKPSGYPTQTYSICSMPAQGGEVKTLLSNEAPGPPTFTIHDPSWARDGRILFQREGDQAGIYVTDSEKINPQRILASEGIQLFPRWSPDGGSIAYLRGYSNGMDLWGMQADGSERQQLMAPGRVAPHFEFGANQRFLLSVGTDTGADIYALDFSDPNSPAPQTKPEEDILDRLTRHLTSAEKQALAERLLQEAQATQSRDGKIEPADGGMRINKVFIPSKS